ncbi:F0F1-type ATP synthase membrane subunit c/vacuolar-type H+-ATPase subunit K [Rossellomorea marisflavi]
MALYLMALAAIVATTGIGIVIRKAMRELATNSDQRQQIQSRMFIGVAIAEMLPLILIVLGFTMLESFTGSVVVPVAITIAVTVVNFVILLRTFLDLVKDPHADKQAKAIVQTTFFIGYALMTAIPIIAIVASVIAAR